MSFGLSMVSRTWAEPGPALALPQPVPGGHVKIVETVLRRNPARGAVLTKGNQVEQVFMEQMPLEGAQCANRAGASCSDATFYLWKA